MPRVFSSVVFGLLVLCWASTASAYDWVFDSDRDGVLVERADDPGSKLMLFRGKGESPVHISLITGVLLETGRGPEWVDLQVISRVTKKQSALVEEIYQRFDLPWPISDRDYTMVAEASFDEGKKQVTVTFQSFDNPDVPPDECCVRATSERTFWRFTALPGDRTLIEVEVKTDPKGSLPAWLVNLIQKDWPYKSIVALSERSGRGDITPYPLNVNW
jgi:hypothetical protein